MPRIGLHFRERGNDANRHKVTDLRVFPSSVWVWVCVSLMGGVLLRRIGATYWRKKIVNTKQAQSCQNTFFVFLSLAIIVVDNRLARKYRISALAFAKHSRCGAMFSCLLLLLTLVKYGTYLHLRGYRSWIPLSYLHASAHDANNIKNSASTTTSSRRSSIRTELPRRNLRSIFPK